MKIQLPEKAKFIIDTITAAGYEAYIVGGCVRDAILGRTPEDWDITTSATPEQVKALFRRTIDTGIQHGTVTVMLEKEGFEVTTYRIDGKYEDSRHPKEVIFTPNLVEDLKRRDFTINAMAYNEESGLIDIFGGIEDIERKMIRCVGEPRERFCEDALRIMRAVRFSAQLGYSIEEQTKEAIKELVPNLKNISAERIQVELVKLLVSSNPDYLRIAYETGITKVVMPEFDKMMETSQNHPHHCYNVGEHTLRSLKEVEAHKALRLAMLFHDIGKPQTLTLDEKGITHFHGHPTVGEMMTKEILRRLRFDNDTIYTVSRLVRYHDYGNGVEPDMRIVRRAVNKIGEDIFPLLFPVKYADTMAQSEYMRQEKLDTLAKWKFLYEEICKQRQCVSLKTMAITGSDLIAAGMKPGREIGEMLSALLELVLENPAYNTKEFLLEEAKNRMQS
uniref:CCA tRNA nucleotidyltransferase n=1 Tax=Acetatifactor sp. TaxID=1872090 RepID=UPI0040566CBD